VGWANSCEFDPDLCRDLMAIGQWIASQAHLMQQLRATAHQAETDALTGLANRARLMRVLDGPGTMHLAGTDGSIIGVLHIDLDHFKTVNDTQGHSVGDAILRHAAQVMLSETGPKDIVARTGGDEFIIAARTDPHGHRLSWLARQLVDRIALPVCIDGVKARVGASIGTAMANEQDRTADRLIANADIALYEVKRNGRGGVMAFKPEMRIAYESSQRVLAELQDAVTQASFVPYFQPQVSMTTGRLTGFEMLARWPHPKLGLLVPEEFLDLAAETRLLDQIDTIVRSKGLKALKKLRAEGWQAPKMSFNASVNTLRDPDLVDGLLYEVKAEGLSPSDLVLEIREAQLVDFSDTEVQDNIRKLSDSGFKVELDEFGTGFTSMSNLPNLAISGVKLDRKIIAPLPDICSESILRAIITLARDLDLTVVAGGVETPAQFAILRNLGCHIAQGFGVSHPLPLDELITFMQGYGSAPVALAI
jgi:diguanylate cyclase (GGDEF)-like protein